MSESGYASGLREFKAAVDVFPERATARFKAVAHDTAVRIVAGYRQKLLSQTKARKTAASARVLDESADKRYVANVPGDPDDPANLSMWLEYGTKQMSAKPALRPTGDEQDARYKRDMASAAEGVLKALE